MAYQSFFAKANNFKRQTPVQCSGKDVDCEFRCRVDGDSVQVVQIEGIDNENKTLTTRVTVYDPNTRDKVYQQEFKTPK